MTPYTLCCRMTLSCSVFGSDWFHCLDERYEGIIPLFIEEVLWFFFFCNSNRILNQALKIVFYVTLLSEERHRPKNGKDMICLSPTSRLITPKATVQLPCCLSDRNCFKN